MSRSVLVFTLLVLGFITNQTTGAAEASLEWSAKLYGDGQHNAFTDLIRWHEAYYVCFRHGASHLSMDGEIRVMRSTDLKAWEPCATIDTLGDDRDPHFTTTGDTLYVYFGTWDLIHTDGHGLPGRGRLRSYFASSKDGQNWSSVQAVYETGWWLWRVRWHEGAFYSVAYAITWPSMTSGEARLLRSEDGLEWSPVSTITKDRIPDEADMRFLADGSMETILRSCDNLGVSIFARSNPERTQWQCKDLSAVIHCPAIVTWKGRVFVSGRGVKDGASVTRIWELVNDDVNEIITLPSAGDTTYPGLLIDPATENADQPAFFITWYSQHERKPETSDEASIYVGRVVLKP